MDLRQTFQDAQQLFAFVFQLYQNKQQAALLIDKDGLERVEGTITAITPHSNVEEASITINNITRVFIKEIMGVNGLFRSDYSEC